MAEHFFDNALDPVELINRYGIEDETIERWIGAMRILYPDKILTNRDFLLYVKNTGWQALRGVQLVDYDQLSVSYRDRLLDGLREEEPDFGLLFKATERAMRTHQLNRDNLLHRVDATFLAALLEKPAGDYTNDPSRGALQWLQAQGLVQINVLNDEQYDIVVTEKGKWALFVYRFYQGERPLKERKI